MAGGLIIALPLYWFRLHNTEITDDDFVSPAPSKDLNGSAVTNVVGKGDAGTMISEKAQIQ